MAKARYFLKDCSSLAVVHETYEMPESTTETDLQIEPRPVHTLAGVLILKAMHKSDHGRTFSSIIMTNGEAQKKCIAFYAAVHRGAQVTEIMKCESYLTYFYTCIKPEYRHKGKFQIEYTFYAVCSFVKPRVQLELKTQTTIQFSTLNSPNLLFYMIVICKLISNYVFRHILTFK